MPITLEQYGIDQLPAEDRLELVGLLWDSLNSERLSPIPEWHQKELKRRLAYADTHLGNGIPLDEAIARVLGKS